VRFFGHILDKKKEEVYLSGTATRWTI